TPMPAPSDQSWTPAPSPAAEPVAKVEPAAPATSGTAAGAWSVVSMDKEPVTQGGGKKKRDGGATGSWQLASGDAPNLDAEGPVAPTTRLGGVGGRLLESRGFRSGWGAVRSAGVPGPALAGLPMPWRS